MNDFVDVSVDIGVVVFETGDEQDFRAVVQKLWPLVEVGGVVLIALDHDRGLFVARPNAKALAFSIAFGGTWSLERVCRDAADQKARVHSRVEERPRQKRARGGLSVRSGHND